VGNLPIGGQNRMPHPSRSNQSDATWQSKVDYALGSVCLVLGLAGGYLVRGSSSRPRATAADPPSHPAIAYGAQPLPSLEEMKQTADKQVQLLLEKLEKDPNHKELLTQIAYSYEAAHQFKQAAAYFARALRQDPANVGLRTERVSCLHYDGDVDGALGQLRFSLKSDPQDVNSLFSLGVILWKGKNDATGAIAAWKKLLETNPNLSRRPITEQMIAEARHAGKHGVNDDP
jgi:cytochrome c-type biogenesis protein CcmH/NrfG